MSIQHDANHGAVRGGAVSGLMAASLDVMGASSFMWRQQHVVGHHAYTNVEGRDPDIRCLEQDVRRVAPGHPWHPYHAFQASRCPPSSLPSGRARALASHSSLLRPRKDCRSRP